jgi:phenylalanyl-tRNA synthetase beta chain
MPTININRKVFEELVKKRLPDDKLKDRISMIGTDIESVDEKEIVTEIFPNRPDLLSVQGFSRAFASFIGTKPGLRDYKVKKSNEKVIIDKSVKTIRPYTACAIVKGINYTDERIKEVIQLQEKLHITYGRNRKKAAIGIYPFEKIKLPITFSAKKPEDIIFRPLEYPKAINARQILSQHPAGKEYGHILEGLDKFPVFTDADGKVLSVPPIINSHDTGRISEKTKDVFIECSGFDFNTLKKCLNMIVTAMADMGGEIYSIELAYPDARYISPDLAPDKMKIDLDYINKRLGLKIDEKNLKVLLERMGFSYEAKIKTVLIPAYRADIIHPIDLVEDIAIAYGYENIEGIIPKVATAGEEDGFEIFKNKLFDMLAGLGLLQINTVNLANIDHQEKLMETKIETVPLANALSLEYNVLRAWVTPSLLECLKNNKQYEYPQKIFTAGPVFKRIDKHKTEIRTVKDTATKDTGYRDGIDDYGTGVIEITRLGVALCSDRTDYTEIRQVLDYLMRLIDIKYSVIETEHSSFTKGRVGRVIVEGKELAYLGEISPKVLKNWALEMPVSLFELNISELFEIIKKK